MTLRLGQRAGLKSPSQALTSFSIITFGFVSDAKVWFQGLFSFVLMHNKKMRKTC